MIRKLMLAISLLCSVVAFGGVPTINGTDDAGAFVPCLNPGTGLPDATCFQLLIRNPALTGTRFDPLNVIADVDVRERVPAGAAVGSVIFFTGNFGDDYYDTPPTHTYAGGTISTMVANGYKTYEVRWLDDAGLAPGEGWLSGMHGTGPETATLGTREIIEWLKTNRASAIELCATGNSFGGVQIAYAIAAHGAGPFLKSAVYSGGPSVADIPRGCFLPTYNNGVLPGSVQSITPGFNVGTRSIVIDAVMGWTDPANNCGTPAVHPTPASTYNTPSAQAMALVSYGSARVARTYSPATRQFFVEAAADPSGATVQALHYYDAVTGYKDFAVYGQHNQLAPNDYTNHLVHNTATGSAIIQGFLLDPANCQ